MVKRAKLPLTVAGCKGLGFHFEGDPIDTTRAHGPVSVVYNFVYPPLFNVTLIGDPNADCIIGVPDDNGNYDGVIGYVQRLEAETAVMTANLELKGEPIKKFLPVWGETRGTIGTALGKHNEINAAVDALQSFKDFHYHLWILTVITVLIVMLIFLTANRMKKLRMKLSDIVWHCSYYLLDQQEFNPTNLLMKLLLLSYCVWIFLLHQYFVSLISANQIVEQKPFIVDSLQDLLKTKLQPKFVEAFPLNAHFEYAAKGSDYSKVWKMTSEKGHKNGDHLIKTVGVGFEHFVKALVGVKNKKYAKIFDDSYFKLFQGIICLALDSEDKPEDINFHNSEQKFVRSLGAQPLSANISKEVEERFAESLYRVAENGMNDIFMKFISDDSFVDLMNIDPTCIRRLRRQKFQETFEPSSFDMKNLVHFRKLLFGSLAFATLVIIIELIVAFNKKRKQKKRIFTVKLKREIIVVRECHSIG